MRSLNDHAHSIRLQHTVQTFCDFGSHFLLNLKTLRIDIDKPCELRNSNNSVARQIADVSTSDDRRHVMLAMRFEPDISK